MKSISKERKKYLGFIYVGGIFFLALLISTISLKYLYNDPTIFIISEVTDSILFEVLIEISTTGFCAAIIASIIDQYQQRIKDNDQELLELYLKQGFRNIFNDNSDPELVKLIGHEIKNARNKITFYGMGLSVLAQNRNLISQLAEKLNSDKKIRLEILFGNHENKGIINRANEEAEWHLRNNRIYDRSWLTIHRGEVESYLLGLLNSSSKSRLKISYTKECPMLMLIKIDDICLISFYGTPNIRGSESPWLLFETNGKIGYFVNMILNYNNLK